MTVAIDERISVRLIEALSAVWSKIRERHPDVPGVVLLAAPSPRRELNVLGHFAALRWSGHKKNGGHFHEVVVVAEHLDREAEAIISTLVHEAAHAMNFERGIFDCSRSQYHNQRFKDAAEELGLEVSQVPHYGFAFTRLPKEMTVVYGKEIENLKKALVHRRRPLVIHKVPEDKPTTDDEDKPLSRNRKAICACAPPFIVRVSKKTLEDTVIRCENCGEPFRLA